jgi:UV DNA damage endonuclease
MFLSFRQCLPNSRISLRTHLHQLVTYRNFQSVPNSWPSTRDRSNLNLFNMPPKRKRSSVAAASMPSGGASIHETPIFPPASSIPIKPPPPKRQASRRKVDTNPDRNADIVDGKTALRASPDTDEVGEALDVKKVNGESAKTNGILKSEEDSDSPLSDAPLEKPLPTPAKKQKKTPSKSSIAAKKGSDEIKAFKVGQAAKKAAETKVKKEDGDGWDQRVDPDGDYAGAVEDVDVVKREAGRPPPVNSGYLPLPWKGRLGYVSSHLHDPEKCS